MVISYPEASQADIERMAADIKLIMNGPLEYMVFGGKHKLIVVRHGECEKIENVDAEMRRKAGLPAR